VVLLNRFIFRPPIWTYNLFKLDTFDGYLCAFGSIFVSIMWHYILKYLNEYNI